MTTLANIVADIAKNFKLENGIDIDVQATVAEFESEAADYDLTDESEVEALAEIISIELDREYDL